MNTLRIFGEDHRKIAITTVEDWWGKELSEQAKANVSFLQPEHFVICEYVDFSTENFKHNIEGGTTLAVCKDMKDAVLIYNKHVELRKRQHSMDSDVQEYLEDKEKFLETHKGSYPADELTAKEKKEGDDLRHLAQWLKSEEGKMKIREAQQKAEEDSKIIDKMNDLSNIDLTRPFDI